MVSSKVGEYCFRLAPYPKTYESAKDDCLADGSHLAYIPSQDVQNGLKDLIAKKKEEHPYFKTALQYWLGAHPLTADEWAWDGFDKPMEVYANWKSRKTGKNQSFFKKRISEM